MSIWPKFLLDFWAEKRVFQSEHCALLSRTPDSTTKKEEIQDKKIMSVKVDPLLRADRLPAERARDDRRRGHSRAREVFSSTT